MAVEMDDMQPGGRAKESHRKLKRRPAYCRLDLWVLALVTTGAALAHENVHQKMIMRRGL